MSNRLIPKKISYIYILVFVLLTLSFVTKKYFGNEIQPLTVVCLGDSITSGFRLPDPKSYSFPSQLEKMSNNKWKVLNAGVPGATAIKRGDIPIWTQGAFFSVLTTTPDVVVLMLGTNDTKDCNWIYKEEYEKNYTELVLLLKELSGKPEVVLCLVLPVMHEHPSGVTNERAKIFTKQVKQIASKTKSHFIDLTDMLENKSELFLDELHPNIKGDTIIAEQLMQAIVAL